MFKQLHANLIISATFFTLFHIEKNKKIYFGNYSFLSEFEIFDLFFLNEKNKNKIEKKNN